MLSVSYMLSLSADLRQGELSNVLKSQITWELQRGMFLSQAECCLESMGLGEGVLNAGLWFIEKLWKTVVLELLLWKYVTHV